MHNSDREVVILASTTAASSSTGAELNIPSGYRNCQVMLVVTAASGTSPTLNVYVQEVIASAGSTDALLSRPSGTKKYSDVISFTQAAATGTWVASIGTPGGNVVGAIKDAALTAGNVANGPIGSNWRVKYVIGGTNPSFSFHVVAKLIP